MLPYQKKINLYFRAFVFGLLKHNMKRLNSESSLLTMIKLEVITDLYLLLLMNNIFKLYQAWNRNEKPYSKLPTRLKQNRIAEADDKINKELTAR